MAMQMAMLLLAGLYAFYRYFNQREASSLPPRITRTPEDHAKDAEAKELAREAAMARQQKSLGKNGKRRTNTRKQTPKTVTITKPPDDPSTPTWCPPAAESKSYISSCVPINARETNEMLVGPLVEVGLTRFYTMPHLPHATQTAALMQRLAREFAPILQRRGYQVYSVSEMCCCGDGLDTGELGGHWKRIAKGQKINGTDRVNCGGYNRTWYRGMGGRRRTRHSIHLRMRHAVHHDIVGSYAELVETMCHELAHCEQQNHSEAFYKVMDGIRQEYQASLKNPWKERGDAADGSDFDIYQSSTGAWRSS